MTLHICATCPDRAVVRSGAGDALSTALAAIATPLGIAVAAEGCMGPCGRGVRVALTGAGRWGWLFQGLDPATDIDAFVHFLAAWQSAPGGQVAKRDRIGLQMRIVGRLPPSQ